MTVECERQFELITNVEKRLSQLNMKKNALEESLQKELQQQISVSKKDAYQVYNYVSEAVLEIETESTIGNSDAVKTASETASETFTQVIDEVKKTRRNYGPYNNSRPPREDQ